MTTNQLNARELLALKRTLHDALTVAEIRAVNWGAIANASAIAFARGWTGDELARFAVEGLDRADDPGAVIYTTIRDLSAIDPPHANTPGPPPAARVLATMHGRNQPAHNPATWAERIRGTLRGGAA